ncbi:MAG TPA: hypothetical protein VJH97_03170 [Candidatus Nanoarchaeia archaeon]|nr:hypothetical protein [Candidatus Nanoarchaeia archaeon]
MALLDFVTSGIVYLWELLKYWFSLFFILPVHNLEILWILIPIWINLVFTDFFQEKKEISLGNAVTNGAIMLWVSIDWMRFLIRTVSEQDGGFSNSLLFKFTICGLVALGGLIIIIQGMRGKKGIRFFGRVRTTSYIMLVYSPVIYGILDISLRYVIAVILFMPLFYGFFAFIDRFTPNPRTYQESDMVASQPLFDMSAPPRFGGLK